MEKAKKEGGGAGSGAVGPAAARTAVGAEHLRLEELLREIEGALSRDDADAGFPALAEELANAMLAHFEREESLYYPTLWALRPEVEAPLKALIGIHPDFRTRPDALVETSGPRGRRSAEPINRTRPPSPATEESNVK